MVGTVNREVVSLDRTSKVISQDSSHAVLSPSGARAATAKRAAVLSQSLQTSFVSAPAPAAAIHPAWRATSPESKAWAALRAHADNVARELGSLSARLQELSVTGSANAANRPAQAATASAAAESAEPGRDFPWPGWPRAPLPKPEDAGLPWRPFRLPVTTVTPEPLPAA